MSDNFAKFSNTLDAPAKNGYAISPNDSADLAVSTRSIYVGGAGNIKLELVGDAAGTFVILNSAVAGSILPLRVRKVWSTGTTASNLVALY
jgi:hypothetical protein